jgi:hypothetical protein
MATQRQRTAFRYAPERMLSIRAGKDEVDVSHRRGARGATLVFAAAVVAVVRLARAVVDGLRRRAVLPTAAELGVEGVEGLRLQAPDRGLPEVGRDVVAHVALVEPPRVRGGVELAEVPVEQLVDRGACAWVTAFGHLDQEPVADLLGGLPCPRAGWDDLDQVVALLRDRVDPGVHAHSQGTARQHLDAAARPVLASARSACHQGRLPPFVPHPVPRAAVC